jgi:hypothetical protein
MEMKRVLSVVCLFMFAMIVRAQVVVSPQSSEIANRSVFGIGASAGVASGFGISFRHHLPGTFSYQVIGGIVKADRKMYYNLGAELQYDFVRAGSHRLFGDAASGYFHVGEEGHNDLTAPFRVALGIGNEWKTSDVFHVTGELLFTYFTDGTILPLPQMSFHYYFF